MIPLSKKFFALLLIIMIVLAIALWQKDYTSRTIEAPHLVITLGETSYVLIIPETRQERIDGMSRFERYPTGYAMLFIFDEDDYHGFWMRNMAFDLDILWFDKDWRLVHYEDSVSHESYPEVFEPATPARYVIEIPPGARIQTGLELGDTVSFTSSLSKDVENLAIFEQ